MSRISDAKNLKERRTIASTIGYCFVIVLVVLLVMSSMLTETYTVALEAERAETMETLAVASSTLLGHYNVSEGMTFPLNINSYAEGKYYIYDVYLKAGNSFYRVYTSSGADTMEQYYLSGVGEEYNNCFEQKKETFTTRSEDGVKYVCAIAPIVSPENTISGILEIRMPYDDYSSTVNGMSLSWILTIFAIAVSMGIIIFELNLLVTTISRGIVGNVPLLIMYGDGAVRFLSFFTAFGAIMPPIVISEFIKRDINSLGNVVVQLLIALGLILYAIGFFAFSAVRKTLKFKLTGRIALILSTAVGYFLSLIAGIADNYIVLLILMLPIAFFYGMAFDSLRDYRINAGKLGYDNFDDRTIHNIQNTSYILGIAVGAVVAGICFERFGLLVVNIIAGAALIIASIGIIYFMRDNNPVRENYLPVNKWLELCTDKYLGRFLASTFVVLGFVASFLLAFIPNYLETVGISLATSSFYYLVAMFTGCLICMIIKDKYNDILTSKIRVIISSVSVVLGFLLFALMPTAKVLFVTVALLGFSLGIHDFYYLYVMFLLTKNRIKANLRRAGELSFLFGLVAALPVFALAFIFNIRIVFIIAICILFIIAFIYPLSPYANEVDDKKVKTKKSKNKSDSKDAFNNVQAANEANAEAEAAPVVPEAPAIDLYAMPEGYEQAVASYQSSLADDAIYGADPNYYANPNMTNYENQPYTNDVYGYQDPNGYVDNPGYDPNNGGDFNGYVE